MNVVFIMCDDHASQAISAYGKSEIETPNIDSLYKTGIRFDHCCCTNSICAPSRASILTGNYSHLNGVLTLNDKLNHSNLVFPELMQEAGYKTGIIGKWHLGHGPEYNPKGFDEWDILIHQGEYHNPIFESPKGKVQVEGYVTDIITEKSIEFMENVDTGQPFFLMCNHKAPHRPWEPAPKYKDIYSNHKFSYPETFNDDYETRSPAAKEADMKIEQLTVGDTKEEVPENLNEQEAKEWKYQRYMQDYFACVKSVDDSVGAIVEYLKKKGLLDNTIIFYTSDQGFYLGEHGWFDKRFMYEESLHMPLIVYHPSLLTKSRINKELIANIDFAPTILELANIDIKFPCQGESFAHMIAEESDDPIHEFIYYRYWQYPAPHNVYPHYGIRSERHKLIYFYLPLFDEDLAKDTNLQEITNNPEKYDFWWEFYDLENDPTECKNVINNEEYKEVIEKMQRELFDSQKKIQDSAL